MGSPLFVISFCKIRVVNQLSLVFPIRTTTTVCGWKWWSGWQSAQKSIIKFMNISYLNPLNMKREKVNFLEYIWWSELGKQNIQTKKVYWLDNFKQVEFINDVFFGQFFWFWLLLLLNYNSKLNSLFPCVKIQFSNRAETLHWVQKKLSP